jgi:xanthine dehydrogenase small subunit
MRSDVVFYLNGRRRVVSGQAAFGSLTEHLRDDCRLVGTKIGCGEGDCGACTVLIGRPSGEEVRYWPATSCILTPCQVDGSHVVTVEGVRSPGGELTPIQSAMVEHHGSQCGYCTPGFVMALTGLFESEVEPGEEALRTGLTGNLCRCTGYLPILEAGRSVARSKRHRPLSDLYSDRSMVADLRALAADSLRVEAAKDRVFARPARAAEAIAFRGENPGAVVIAGGTDLGVWRNRHGLDPPRLLSLAGVADWAGIGRERGEIVIGANVTWSELEAFARREAPALLDVTHHFASPQIRNVATFLGNVAGGSPIADAVGFLHVLGAQLELVSPGRTRTVAVGDFFTGYRKTVLAPDELIARVAVRLPREGERLGLYKVSKRKEIDISTFRASILVSEAGGRVDRAALAFAGVGPTVLRLPATESFLLGRPLSEETFREAGRRARAEVEPISDVRGSRDYRLILAENILLKFYRDHVESGPEGHALVG